MMDLEKALAGAPTTQASTTVGVTVPIPSPYAEQLQDARRAAGDPLAEHIPPHVTLLPPTPVPDEVLADFEAHLLDVAASRPRFRITLRGTGTFRPLSPVVFAAVAAGISDCEALEMAVRSGPVKRELLFPYHPHVTIAQNVSDDRLDAAFEDLAGFTCTFTVDSFALYHHVRQDEWRPVRHFMLS